MGRGVGRGACITREGLESTGILVLELLVMLALLLMVLLLQLMVLLLLLELLLEGIRLDLLLLLFIFPLLECCLSLCAWW